MAKSDAVIDEDAKAADQKPVVVKSKRKPSKAVKIAAVVAAGAALFAGGVLVANQFAGGSDEVNTGQEAFATQQLIATLNQGDALIQQAQGLTTAEELQAKGAELQRLAVAMEALPAQFSDDDLRETVEQLADGYLNISIGLVTNSGTKTDEGAKQLTEGREKLVEILGVDQEQGTGDTGQTDQQGETGTGDTGTDQQESGN